MDTLRMMIVNDIPVSIHSLVIIIIWEMQREMEDIELNIGFNHKTLKFFLQFYFLYIWWGNRKKYIIFQSGLFSEGVRASALEINALKFHLNASSFGTKFFNCCLLIWFWYKLEYKLHCNISVAISSMSKLRTPLDVTVTATGRRYLLFR